MSGVAGQPAEFALLRGEGRGGVGRCFDKLDMGRAEDGGKGGGSWELSLRETDLTSGPVSGSVGRCRAFANRGNEP
jgi:hypothetical protein